MAPLLSAIGRRLGHHLAAERHVHGVAPPTPIGVLLETLQPCDVLLVEGHSRISTAIKYLTQSTWSHAALFVGTPEGVGDTQGTGYFVEADILAGVRAVGAAQFESFHTRICRPLGLTPDDRNRVIEYVVSRIGYRYDLRNVIDLARYLLPTPPVPQRFRRRMIALGSGDPTRAICSTLIAQAFQAIRYPILPMIEVGASHDPDCPGCRDEILHIRHHSLFVPRDFDVSPYFQVVKPALAPGFAYRSLRWADGDGDMASGGSREAAEAALGVDKRTDRSIIGA